MSALNFLNIPSDEFDVFEDEPLDEIQASGFRVIGDDEKDEDEDVEAEEDDEEDEDEDDEDDEEDEEDEDPDAVVDEPVDGLQELEELAEKYEDLPLNMEVEYED